MSEDACIWFTTIVDVGGYVCFLSLWAVSIGCAIIFVVVEMELGVLDAGYLYAGLLSRVNLTFRQYEMVVSLCSYETPVLTVDLRYYINAKMKK